MKQLIAKNRLDYAGKTRLAGERFEATAGDARILTVTGLATLADPEVQAPAARRRYKRRDMQAGA